MEKILARGAEAVIIKKQDVIIKNRIPKGYRYPELDEKLRKLRTRAEAKLLEKSNSIIPTPKLIKMNEQAKTLELEFISGKKLSQSLDKLQNKNSIAKQIGHSLAKLHDHDLIHGDLTTSNLILKKDKVYFIDFGLGFHSSKAEDKATDLHVLKEALEAKHPASSEELWNNILQGYKKSKNAKATIGRLEKVELRGRYKEQY
ncbi:MAG: KEOPS complex kinase/ATPase Bud32 [Nanoarchaeota archaeon]